MLELAAANRRPLALQAHKPIPIASYAPRFEDDFAPGRHYDPDVERNNSKKVRALYKKERSGAIRELRKDNRFLAGEKAKEQAEKDRVYGAKMRRAEGEITTERAEEKQMQRYVSHSSRHSVNFINIVLQEENTRETARRPTVTATIYVSRCMFVMDVGVYYKCLKRSYRVALVLG